MRAMTMKAGLLGSVGFVIAMSMASAAQAASSKGQYMVRSGQFQVGQEVKLYRIKDECRWPSVLSADHSVCRESLGAGKIIQQLDGKNVLIQSDLALDERTQVE